MHASRARPAADASGLPDYGRLPEFSLIADDGEPFTRDDLSGDVWVVDYISVLENGEPLGRADVAAVRVAIPGDRDSSVLSNAFEQECPGIGVQ